jgi:hypothetical protein
MAYMLSPGITVVEKDLTTIVPAVSTSVGGVAGLFSWGPVEDPIRISNENELIRIFGTPTNFNFQSFFTAANFLSYSNNTWVCRVDAPGLINASESGNSPETTSLKIKNLEDYTLRYINGNNDVGCFAGKYPGTKANDIKIVILDKGAWDTLLDVEKSYYINIFGGAPGTSEYAEKYGISDDEVHIAVFDTKSGTFTGVVDQNQRVPLEVYKFASKLSDAKKLDGSTNYYKNIINNNSPYLWWMDHPVLSTTGENWGKSVDEMLKSSTKAFKTLTSERETFLSNGEDDYSLVSGNIRDAYDIYKNAETYDISLLMTGNIPLGDSAYIIQNIAELRKDCVVFVSPNDDLEPIVGIGSAPIQKMVDFRNGSDDGVPFNTSYAIMDSGWKYQYDRYNDTYRWIPLNGDIAGVCARSDNLADPWFSPAGLNRGNIKNIIRLGVNPDQTSRDTLYANNINPVVTLPGQGTVLYGDKTLLTKPSAFDRINVRRLFIILEKAISLAARYQLFEFNDEFTRSQFRNIVEPFLRDVQGRRGIFDFKVVCDETNNTPEVIDRNEFIGSIFIKPARSINFMTLNFVAVRTGISFEEVA